MHVHVVTHMLVYLGTSNRRSEGMMLYNSMPCMSMQAPAPFVAVCQSVRWPPRYVKGKVLFEMEYAMVSVYDRRSSLVCGLIS